MRQDVKDAWVAWLEDVSHKKGIGHLRAGDQYCVLGALVAVANEMGLDTGWGFLQINNVALPVAVQQWAELDSRDPYVTVRDERYCLTYVNDAICATFPEMAIMIKESL